MKKTLSLILALALVLSCVLVVVSADDEDPQSYLWMKGTYTGNADTDVQPGLSWVFDNSSGILENGKTYTAFAYAKFDEGSTGTVYCNVYVYNDYEKAKAADWTGLMNFLDFAKCGSIDGVWNEFTASWVFSDHSYGSEVLPDETIGGLTIGIGFWQASGGISVSEIGVKDESGEVIWSQTFGYGLDLTADDIGGNYLVVGDEGNSWGLVGADITLPDESDEPSEDEPAYPAAKGEVISNGKSYTTENYTVRTDGYGDPDYVKLTDGVKDDNGGAAPAGFNFAEGANSASIIVDLGAETEIAAIVADLQGGNWGIPASNTYSVSFAISADGENYEDLVTIDGANADVIKESTDESLWNVTNFECICNHDTVARYVKVTYNKPADYTGNHVWPSEIQIFGVASGEEPSEDPSEEPSEEPSKDPENPPKTGDNGMIALAVISVIALAGAVVVKKSK